MMQAIKKVSSKNVFDIYLMLLDAQKSQITAIYKPYT